ncbi:MAG: hypothetical protein V2J25_04125 [Desulfatiglans sp.]|jgi:hypothetical protein|nr:hypothetical protein [Thermodesulfobacteriota bacterium]MEE4352035.1 hypothetical protein [Desulfatiglans sp.]
MHDVLDTEAEDLRSETYWPDSYKRFIREVLPARFQTDFENSRFFNSAFGNTFDKVFGSREDFFAGIVHRLVIGAENGAEKATGEIYSAMRRGTSIAVLNEPYCYIWETFLNQEDKRKFREIAYLDLHGEHILEHFYEDHYRDVFSSHQAFITAIVNQILIGAENGVDDMLVRIIQAIAMSLPLPRARRFSRILKTW